MRKLIWVINVLFVFMFCNCSNTPINNIDESETTNMVGNDADEHGCRASAGYVWSNLRQECIRTFEVGVPFIAYGTNTDSTLAAYIVLNDDNSKGELYMPNFKTPFQLNKVENKKSVDGILIFENDSAKIDVVISGSKCLIQVNKIPVFVQQIDDDESLYSKMNGIE